MTRRRDALSQRLDGMVESQRLETTSSGRLVDGASGSLERRPVQRIEKDDWLPKKKAERTNFISTLIQCHVLDSTRLLPDLP